jgi:hypothetical protein
VLLLFQSIVLQGDSKMKKSLSLDNKSIDGQNISYCIFGKGDIDLVIEMGLGAVAGEWWNIHRGALCAAIFQIVS